LALAAGCAAIATVAAASSSPAVPASVGGFLAPWRLLFIADISLRHGLLIGTCPISPVVGGLRLLRFAVATATQDAWRRRLLRRRLVRLASSRGLARQRVERFGYG
jgi:hypothetical protein